ncbi:uncharacterized protein LOC129702937 isoform X2 [Leucoraja erinacea]|uniref:uncharacterized protein LOC129702937 isoform X2 n=1 Tax=Leucoraja erinaceus TaxID=7782 RepID=UPI00245390D1|nr:uncharacterized protein LOC129702937 isoform X2 [Leucoraja erinacea]
MEQEEPVIQQELAGRITLYSMTGCLHCHHAKDRLSNMGLPFFEVNVVKNPEIHQQIVHLTGRLTVPQIYFNNIHVGGNDDFLKLSQEELDKLIDLVKNEPVPPDAPPIPAIVEVEVRKEEPEGKVDEYADLIMDFKESGMIGSNWICLKTYHNTFTGKKLVNWLVDNKNVDKSTAIELGKDLTNRKFLNPLAVKEFEDSNALYRLVEHDSAASLTLKSETQYTSSASRHSAIMKDLIVKLFSEHITPDGKIVDYKSMGANPVFDEYCQHATHLQLLDIGSLSRNEKLALFINVYNTLVIHGNIKKGPPKNAWQRYRASLDDAEPRIHFALNFGAASSPPIKAYSAEDIDKQLNISARDFLDSADGCQVDVAKKEVGLSIIFKRYKVDFGGTDEKVLKWVSDHLSDSTKKKALTELLDQGKARIIYLPFDWSTNAKD